MGLGDLPFLLEDAFLGCLQEALRIKIRTDRNTVYKFLLGGLLSQDLGPELQSCEDRVVPNF